MKCTKCGTDYQGNFCPNCGSGNHTEPSHPNGIPKKRSPLKIVGIVISVFVLLSVIGGIIGENEEPAVVSANAPADSGSVESQTIFGVGEAVRLNDIVVTMTDVSQNTGDSFNRPSDGKIFVVCSFEISNESSKDITVSSLMSFEAYVDSYATNLSLSAQMTAEGDQLDGSVAAGKKMAGAIGYELPADWKELEVCFTPDFWNDQEIIFTAHNS